MLTRQIDLDEESNQLLNDLAQDYGGDAGRALGELLHSREGIEDFLDVCEAAQTDTLLLLRAGRTWRNGELHCLGRY